MNIIKTHVAILIKEDKLNIFLEVSVVWSMAQENTTNDDEKKSITFDDYKWEQDEEWQILIKKLEFPPTFDEKKKEKHLLKRKQKYFKEKIDPNFQPTTFS